MVADPGELLRPIAAELLTRVADLSKALTARILEEDPQLGADPTLADMLGTSVRDNVSTVLRVFELRPDPDTVQAPEAAVDYARRLAQHGVPISALLRTYRLGQASFQQAMLAEVAHADLDAATVAAAAEELSSVAFTYVDRISEEVVAAYQQEHDDWMRNRTAARAARVSALLASSDTDLAEVEKTLNYRIDQTHLALVAWSVSGGAADRLARVERQIARTSQELGLAGAPLTVVRDESTVWAWVPWPDRSTVMLTAPEDDDVRIAAGAPARGLDGFRRSHRQARHAQVVALAADADVQRPVTTWGEVGSIALMCGDRASLGEWVRETLGGLAADGESAARLRETLSTFLETGGSFTSAARLLHMHKNTVQYRVRKAEESLGHPVAERRRDVELALQVCEWLGTSVLRPS